MPNYQVTAPDGRKYRVAAPEGATQEQALAYAQQNYSQGQQPERTRLQKIEAALRAADAAGNTDDARRLAQAYAAERDSPSAASNNLQDQTGGQPIVVQGTDGQEFEFPAGTSQDVMRTALAKHYGREAAPKADYTEQQLIGALRKADAAGDTEAARAIARRIQSMRQGALPKADFSNVRSGSSAAANFDNVRSGISSTEAPQASGATYSGPLLAQSASAAGAAPPPSLDTINARNRAFRGSPEAAAQQQAYEQSQAEAKRRELPTAVRRNGRSSTTC